MDTDGGREEPTNRQSQPFSLVEYKLLTVVRGIASISFPGLLAKMPPSATMSMIIVIKIELRVQSNTGKNTL